MNNTQINISTDIADCDAILINSYMDAGRVFAEGTVQLSLSREDVYSLISRAFLEDIKPCTVGVYSSKYGGMDIQMLNESDGNCILQYCIVADASVVRSFKNALSINGYERKRKAGVHDIRIIHYYLINDKLDSQVHNRDTESFDKLFVEMYPKIDIKEMMHQFSVSDESLMILSGQPGTGKTCVAKLMMAAHANTIGENINVVYVKDREILKMDRFWVVMTSMEPDMMILDDLDNELLPRGSTGNQIVSNMLSYSDGIFDVKTKILITTNLTDSCIDKALVRPGRSFDTLCLPQLDSAEAKDIWLNKFEAPEGEFVSRFSDMPVISQAALMSEYQRFLKSGSPTYLRDPSISVRKLVEEGVTINHED